MVANILVPPVLPEITCAHVALFAAKYAGGNCTALKIIVAPTAILRRPTLSILMVT